MFETRELPRQRLKLISRSRGGVCLPDTVEATDWLGVMRNLVAVCPIPSTLIYERQSFTAYPIINWDEQTVLKSFAATLLLTVPSSHMPSKRYFMGRLHYNGSVHHDGCHRWDDGISQPLARDDGISQPLARDDGISQPLARDDGISQPLATRYSTSECPSRPMNPYYHGPSRRGTL
jgi:hypothetical protein